MPGQVGLKDLEAMLARELIGPAGDAFGACFTRSDRTVRRSILGFDKQSLLVAPRKVSGLDEASSAARAGLRNGDVILSFYGDHAHRTNPDQEPTTKAKLGAYRRRSSRLASGVDCIFVFSNSDIFVIDFLENVRTLTSMDTSRANAMPETLKGRLAELNLATAEAATLLGLSERSLRRYLDEEAAAGTTYEAPGPVVQALTAWLRLQRQGLAWRPDEQAIQGEDTLAIAEHRKQAIDLASLLERVRARGGPSLPWEVDVEAGRARLGAMSLSFYKLANGGFSAQSYTRRDMEPDLTRDYKMLEDGIACIASAMQKKGLEPTPPVSLGSPGLVGDNIVMWENATFPTFVLLIPYDAARAAAGDRDDVPPSKVLDFMARNRAALARVAVDLVAREVGEINNLGARVLNLSAAELSAARMRRVLSTSNS